MRTTLRSVVTCLVLGSVLVACSGSSGDVAGVSSGTPGDGASSGAPPPASGACGGRVACGAHCTNLDEDRRHCGACGRACADGEVCDDGVCVAGTCEARFATTCGDLCVQERDHPQHCGACGNACAAGTVCHEGACVAALGTGTSCADPVVMPGGGDNVRVAFTFDGASETQVLTCGDLTARPRRVFRFTANKTKDGARFEIEGGLPTNDLVLEVFSEPSCEPARSVGCSDDDRDARPVLEIPITSGKTYFVVVSSKGPPPPGTFYVKFDD